MSQHQHPLRRKKDFPDVSDADRQRYGECCVAGYNKKQMRASRSPVVWHRVGPLSLASGESGEKVVRGCEAIILGLPSLLLHGLLCGR